MFGHLGLLAAHHPRKILVFAVVVVLGAVPLGFTAFDKLQTEGFTDPAAESTTAQELIDEHFGGSADLVVLVDAGSAGVDHPSVQRAGQELSAALAADPALSDVTSYFDTEAPGLRSDDGRYALAVAHVEDEDDETIADLRDQHGTDSGPIRVTMGGEAAVGADIRDQVGTDLAVAESIAVPLVLILLLLAFRSLVAAALPLVLGAVTVFATFAELAVLGSVTDVSIYAVNLTIALGLGLAIDYALLMVSRFREELSREELSREELSREELSSGSATAAAVVRTVETAGRTIAFSAATVAAALAVLLVFPLYFLRSFAYAGIGVVILAMVSALLVVPALLALLGPRIERGRLPWARQSRSQASGFWRRVAGTVTRRPLVTAAPVIVVLLLAAVPLLRVEFGTPDDRVLTTANDSRVVGDTLRAHFPGDETRAIQVVTTSDASPATIDAYAARLGELPGVATVGSSASARSEARLLVVGTDEDPKTSAAQDLVRQIRDIEPPAGITTYVGGEAARLVDSKAAIGARLPIAAGLIAGITFVVLFLFTGSMLQPLRALLFNLVGLSATMGLMVLIFQHGWLSSILGFTPLPLDISMLVLLFCITFGLSMDYEVFVLSRIRETHEAGADPVTAVTEGLAHSGRIVSTAAALLAVNFFAFGTSGVSFIQMFGIGCGVAILIDATLIRGVLVPAGMRVLGRAAWWAPTPLRRLHDRIGAREAPPEVRQGAERA